MLILLAMGKHVGLPFFEFLNKEILCIVALAPSLYQGCGGSACILWIRLFFSMRIQIRLFFSMRIQIWLFFSMRFRIWIQLYKTAVFALIGPPSVYRQSSLNFEMLGNSANKKTTAKTKQKQIPQK